MSGGGQDRPNAGQRKKPQHLSEREKQCLSWAAVGRSTKQIASALDIAPDTVNEHIAAAMRKLGARTRTEAVIRLITGIRRTHAADKHRHHSCPGRD